MLKVYERLIRPALFAADAERAHELGLAALRLGLSNRKLRNLAHERYAAEEFGTLDRFGLTFRNPIGLAAGFDKNGVATEQLAALGFGSVEVGTVTAEPQKGNEKPRLFRLPSDQALINRLGFNNDGARVIAERLERKSRDCVIGINIGKNKEVPVTEATANYLSCFELVFDAADYIAVNVSSPNTPNLRELQRSENLRELLLALQERNRQLSGDGRPKPLLVKIAPDLSDGDIREIVDVCIELQIAGMIATNTTIRRDGLTEPNVDEIGAGGLSGRPLAGRSNEVISVIYRHSEGGMPIIGVGGVFNGRDAFNKIAAGASLLQAYTGFVYGGPGFVRMVSKELVAILRDKGFSSIDEAVGSSC